MTGDRVAVNEEHINSSILTYRNNLVIKWIKTNQKPKNLKNF